MSSTAPTIGPSRAKSDAPVPFVRRVRIRNYKSIAHCDVELGPLTVLVGRNGSGKSNFLDALAFIYDAVMSSVDSAIRRRNGFDELCWKGNSHSESFALELDFVLRDGRTAVYGFEIGAQAPRSYSVRWERLEVEGLEEASYYCENGQLVRASSRLMDLFSSWPPEPDLDPNRLLLLFASAAFRPIAYVINHIIKIFIYRFSMDEMRDVSSPGVRGGLLRDGSNIASVIGRITADQPAVKERIVGYLGSIVPGVTGVDRVLLGPKETLEFEQSPDAGHPPRKFYAWSMSDGTLRALGALVAVAQLADGGIPVRLVGIEEPETALHPAASAALMDALKEAAVHTQVVVTTHSPDLLDHLDLEHDRLLVVQMRDGVTEIGRVDRASREAVAEHLATPGELLRMDYLEPDREDLERQRRSSPLEVAERPE
jgi:predicted ATPase